MPDRSSSYWLKNASGFGWGQNSAILDKERIKLLDKFTLGKKVLDIGCGSGIYVDYLSRRGFLAYGVDLVGDFLKQASKTKKGIFTQSMAEELPFEDNFFDSVYLFDILEHGDDKKILNEAKRVAKKKILVIVPKKVSGNLADSGVVYRHYIDKSHLREYWLDDVKKLANVCNLRLVHLQAIHPLYNETIFLELFGGSLFLKKLIRKLVFAILPKKLYQTEIFAVFEK